MRRERNFIDGTFVDADGEPTIAVCNPATGECIAEIDAASDAQVKAAVAAASRSQRGWGRLPAIERARYLQRLADALVANACVIGAALAGESGKSVADASNEAIYAAEITRYHAEWARRIEGEMIPSDSAGRNDSAAARTDRRGRLPDSIQLSGLHADAQDRPGVDHRQYRGRPPQQQHAAVRLRNRTGCASRRPCPPGVVNILAMQHDTSRCALHRRPPSA